MPKDQLEALSKEQERRHNARAGRQVVRRDRLYIMAEHMISMSFAMDEFAKSCFMMNHDRLGEFLESGAKDLRGMAHDLPKMDGEAISDRIEEQDDSMPMMISSLLHGASEGLIRFAPEGLSPNDDRQD
jgi:hypothetical protein